MYTVPATSSLYLFYQDTGFITMPSIAGLPTYSLELGDEGFPAWDSRIDCVEFWVHDKDFRICVHDYRPGVRDGFKLAIKDTNPENLSVLYDFYKWSPVTYRLFSSLPPEKNEDTQISNASDKIGYNWSNPDNLILIEIRPPDVVLNDKDMDNFLVIQVEQSVETLWIYQPEDYIFVPLLVSTGEGEDGVLIAVESIHTEKKK